jgi:hypothetical protein
MTNDVRLRQVALVARDLEPVADELREALGLGEPFRDPGVGDFGLTNVVFAVGDTFLEVVSPVREGTTAGRYLDRRGGDSGYMAIFQYSHRAGLVAARERLDTIGVRTVWRTDLPDIAGTHLHPKDVPGAIVSLDWADPTESWRWAGPAWIGGAPAHAGGGITGITIEAGDPTAAAARWAAVLGGHCDGAGVPVAGGSQTIAFAAAPPDREAGITQVRIASPRGAARHTIAGVRFVLSPIALRAAP